MIISFIFHSHTIFRHKFICIFFLHSKHSQSLHNSSPRPTQHRAPVFKTHIIQMKRKQTTLHPHKINMCLYIWLDLTSKQLLGFLSDLVNIGQCISHPNYYIYLACKTTGHHEYGHLFYLSNRRIFPNPTPQTDMSINVKPFSTMSILWTLLTM